MKTLSALLLVVVGSAFGQTYSNGAFHWTLTQDVSNSTQYCNPTCQTLWHTATIHFTAHNRRTGQTVTKDDSGMQRVVSITADVPAQPGDIVDYTDTQTVTCPVMGTIVSIILNNWSVEYAATQSANLGLAVHAFPNDTYNTRAFCNNTAHPDYNPSTLSDTAGSNPDGWIVGAICSSPTGHQPWGCGKVAQGRLGNGMLNGSYQCTYNP